MSKAMARGVGRKSLMVPAELLARGVRRRVPVLSGDTYESVDVLPAKQRKGVAVQVVVEDIASVQLEFGNSDQAATPFFRPEVDAGRAGRDQAFADALMIETNDAVIRKAARDARKLGRG
ncbi:HK97-gp10 family putative phage morphogenesis protein [Sphingobium sp. TomMM35A]